MAFAASLLVGTITVPQFAEAAPGGSYRDTCRNFSTSGPILSADCQSGWGWRHSQIEFRRCSGDIANDRGYLVCRGDRYGRDDDRYDNNDRYGDDDRYDNDRGDRWGDNRWGGNRWGGGNGLILFGNYNYRGEAYPTSGDVSNLGGTRFNDRAQSVRIDRGVWQLCENANFGGRCITLDRSVTDLGRFGMNSTVSSVRRIR